MTIFWIDNQGAILKATSDDGQRPTNSTAIKVPPNPAPKSGKQIWNFISKTWNSLPPPPPSRNSVLDTAIDGASTLAALKAVLRGSIVAR